MNYLQTLKLLLTHCTSSSYDCKCSHFISCIIIEL